MADTPKLTVPPHMRLRPDHIEVWDEVVLAKDYTALVGRLDSCEWALKVRTAERDEFKTALSDAKRDAQRYRWAKPILSGDDAELADARTRVLAAGLMAQLDPDVIIDADLAGTAR